MNETTTAGLEPIRFEARNAMLIAGLRERYSPQTMSRIPELWQRLAPYLDKVSDRVGPEAFGVCYKHDDAGGFDYLCGFEVNDLSRLPDEFAHLRIPQQRYAVFAHNGHVSELSRTVDTVFRKWLPTSGLTPAALPDFLERYGPQFDPVVGKSDVEVWLPIAD